MFLEGSFHDLSLSSDSPDSDFSLHATSDNSLAVVGSSQGCNSMVVSVVNGVAEFS